MFLCTQISQKAQKATFFVLDVFMRTKIAKNTRRKGFLLLRRFLPPKNAVFFICLSAFCAFYAFLPLRCCYARLRLLLFLCPQKLQKAQDVKRFFFLTVLCAQGCCLLYLLTCVLCFLCQTSNFLHLRCFYARLRLSWFLFAYLYFVLFLHIKPSCKRYETLPVPSFIILLFRSPPSYIAGF